MTRSISMFAAFIRVVQDSPRQSSADVAAWVQKIQPRHSLILPYSTTSHRMSLKMSSPSVSSMVVTNHSLELGERINAAPEGTTRCKFWGFWFRTVLSAQTKTQSRLSATTPTFMLRRTLTMTLKNQAV